MTALVDKLRKTQTSIRSKEVIERLALELGVEEAMLQAFIDVEAGGIGFDKDRAVKILFEKHRFYKNLPPSQRDEAVRLGLARRNWVSPRNGGYKDQVGPEARWDLLDKASDLNESAALASTSWGLGQVMGENWKSLGYSSPQEFAELNAASEDFQFDAMRRYFEKNGLAPAMRRKDFNELARRYNGPGQVAVYGPRLKRAYENRKK